VGSVDAMRKKKTSETNESALKVSLILEGLHLTLYAALMRTNQPLHSAKAEKKV
jgi:hypothetical protein